MLVLLYRQEGYDRAVLRGIARYAQLHGPWLFYVSNDLPGLPQALPETFISYDESQLGDTKSSRPQICALDLNRWGITGIIGRLQTSKVAQQIERSGLPIVAMDLSYEQGERQSSNSQLSEMCPDSLQAGSLAAEHLLERGLRQFAFCGFANRNWSDIRLEGFQRRLADACCTCQVYDPPTKYTRSWDLENKVMQDWLLSLPQPVGLLACNDIRGRQVLEACYLAGLTAPDQIAVVGVDNDEMVSALTFPSLSSVSLDCERGGYNAAELLNGMMQGKITEPQRLLVKALRVVPRRSTDVIAVEDLHVTRALQFIRDHARNRVGVDDVAKYSKLSRRALEIRFRQFLERSVREEIQRVRLMWVQQFLIDTNLPAWRIAEETGFNSLEYLSRVFRNDRGVSLTEFRALHRTA